MNRPEMRWTFAMGCSVLSLALTASGCVGTTERTARKDMSDARNARSPTQEFTRSVSEAPVATTPPLATDVRPLDLDAYVAAAMDKSPELRGAFERWEASVKRISQARRLPDPQISFGYFLQAVETRVGPQRARISLKQSFPWPTRLTASADAAAASARAQQARVDALALSIKQRVETVYWKLWLIRQTRRIHAEHLLVVHSLSESVLARVSTGATTLADLQQVDLTAARLEDMLRGMDEAETTAIAQLHGLMGTHEPPTPSTATSPPPAMLPSEDFESLARAVKSHPFILSFSEMAAEQEELARAKNAERYPNFTIGADWIITDEARMPNVEDSGKDALILGGGMTIPLWQGAYSDGVDAARAEASAQMAGRDAAEDRAVAELEASLAAVRDAARRVNLYETTLVPQADSAYSSVLGAYATGQGTVAQTLLAQRDLLELRGELEEARAAHAGAWTRLESVVGRQVSAGQSWKAAPTGKSDGKH